jgi:hypothetical protein
MARFTNKVWRIMCPLLEHYSSNFIGEPRHPIVDTLFFKLYWWTMSSNSEHIVLQTLLVNHAIQQWTHSSNFIGEPCRPTMDTLFFKLYWWTVPSNSGHIVLQTLLVNRAVQQWTHCSVHQLSLKNNVSTVGWHGSPIKFEEQCVHYWMARFTNKVWRTMCPLLDGTVHQ